MYLQLKLKLTPSQSLLVTQDSQPTPGKEIIRQESLTDNEGEEDEQSDMPILSQPTSTTPNITETMRAPFDNTIRARRSRSARSKEDSCKETLILDKLTKQVEETVRLQQQMQSILAMERYNERLLAAKYFGQVSLRIHDDLYDNYRLEVTKVLDKFV